MDKEDYQQRLMAAASEFQHTKKKMQELRTGIEELKNELSTVQGKFEAAETSLAMEQAESESLRRNLSELKEQLNKHLQEGVHHEQLQQGIDNFNSRDNTVTEDTAGQVEELRRKLRDAEEKLDLATRKALEIEMEKEELLNSFLAQVSQTSLMEQQLFEEKEQLQLQLDGTLQQLKNTLEGQQGSSEYDSTSGEQVEISGSTSLEEHLGDSLQTSSVEESSTEVSEDSFQFLMESKVDVEPTMVPERLLKEVREERDMLEQELKKALKSLKSKNMQRVQLEAAAEQRLQEKIYELTVKLKEKDEEALASAEVMAEKDGLKEELDEALCKIKKHEKSEEQMKEEIHALRTKLNNVQEHISKLKPKLEREIEKARLTSQLEAELMEKTCVMSQLTGEKVVLQFKVKELQQEILKMQQETSKLNSQFETQLLEKSCSVSQLTAERDGLQYNFHELQKQVQETQQQREPQISDKDVVSYEEVKLTQSMLGTGAWGYVVMGRFRGKVVAAKCLHKDILSRFSKSQVQREISIMAELRHPNLVLFIAAVLDAPTGPMIITELLSYTLRRAYQEEIITSRLGKLSVMQDVAMALNYLHLHHKPIIHRDISSTNVLLEELAHKQWRAKLSDFGSANLVRLASTPGEGALVYSAPEMRTEAHKPQDPSADVYSYGVLLCEVVTSSFPDHTRLAGMLETARTESPDVSNIIEMCLLENPSSRPTMGVVITQLEELISTVQSQ